MYKFTKIYSGGEPDLEEGDVFRLTVPLINSEPKNPAIEPEKLAIDDQNSAIEPEKLAIGTNEGIIEKINSAIEKNRFSEPTKLKILAIYQNVGKGQVFGAQDIVQIVECSSSTARELIKKLRKMDVIEEVKGNGKGRYRFILE